MHTYHCVEPVKGQLQGPVRQWRIHGSRYLHLQTHWTHILGNTQHFSQLPTIPIWNLWSPQGLDYLSYGLVYYKCTLKQ